MLKILVLFGTRPEAIKMAPLVNALKAEDNFDTKICVTAQHREMLDQVLDLFEINPNFDLNIMKSSQTLGDITSLILQKIDNIFLDFIPDLVLVHGDTATTFAGTLGAYYRQIPVGHVEAGLRTGNIYSPWPEEGNRKLTGSIANIHFAPTKLSKTNLEREGVKKGIYVTGNTVIDALFWIKKKIDNSQDIYNSLLNYFHYLDFEKDILLVTGHRRESFGEGFKNICKAILKVAAKNKNLQIVYPVHLNPNVQTPVNDMLAGVENIFLIDPLEYLQFSFLMMKSKIILTDSGGIQEEAPSLGKPVLLMRETTERPEALDAGTVELVGTNINLIEDKINILLKDNKKYETMSMAHNPYGDGKASIKIIEAIKQEFSEKIS